MKRICDPRPKFSNFFGIGLKEAAFGRLFCFLVLPSQGIFFGFSLASGLCFSFANVAPVPPPGKRKPLTPPIPVSSNGLSTSPFLTRQRALLAAVASAFGERLTCSIHPCISRPLQTVAAPLRQTVCRLSHRKPPGTECFFARTARLTARKRTHSLPQMGTGKALARAVEEVLEAGEARI